jgi:leucyl-tRNA synthetase
MDSGLCPYLLRNGRDHGRPAHDTRDFDFAVKFGIPIRSIIERTRKKPPHSRSISRMSSPEKPAGRASAIHKQRELRGLDINGLMSDGEVEDHRLACRARHRKEDHKLQAPRRLFSRQRYGANLSRSYT